MVEHEERQRQNQIVVVDEQRTFLAEPLAERCVTNHEQQCHQQETYHRHNYGPKEESVFFRFLTSDFGWLSKIRVETHYRSTRAELRQADEQRSGIDHHARQADILCRQKSRDNKERRNKAYRHAKIRDDSAFDTLFCYDAHSRLCNSHDWLLALFLDTEQFNLEDQG